MLYARIVIAKMEAALNKLCLVGICWNWSKKHSRVLKIKKDQHKEVPDSEIKINTYSQSFQPLTQVQQSPARVIGNKFCRNFMETIFYRWELPTLLQQGAIFFWPSISSRGIQCTIPLLLGYQSSGISLTDLWLFTSLSKVQFNRAEDFFPCLFSLIKPALTKALV